MTTVLKFAHNRKKNGEENPILTLYNIKVRLLCICFVVHLAIQNGFLANFFFVHE